MNWKSYKLLWVIIIGDYYSFIFAGFQIIPLILKYSIIAKNSQKIQLLLIIFNCTF